MGRKDKKPALSKQERATRPVLEGQKALKDAEALQQRADRKSGNEAVNLYEQAAARFRDAMARSDQLTGEETAAAHFGLGETLQEAAGAKIAGSKTASDEDLRSAQQQATISAKQMLSEAVHQYQLVREADGSVRSDAVVNAGNVLSAWAELEDSQQSLALLERAARCYQDALSKEEEATVFSNLGDVLVSAAERLKDSDLGHCRQLYDEAATAYSQACSLSSSDAGDDLPGLLHNWGVGLHSAGVNLQDPGALAEAVEKLRHAASFNRADCAVLNALGDALVASAELSADLQLRLQLLQRGLEEGYQAALRIDRSQMDGTVGTAEVELLLGRAASGSEAAVHFQRSASAYAAALQRPQALGGFQDRCEIRFNAACAAALSGDLQGAERILRGLLALEGTSIAEVLNERDFAALHHSPFFLKLKSEAT